MTLRLLADAAAQTTVSGAITAVQTSIVGQSTANFPVPAAGQQSSLVIIDQGNPGFNAATPLATPYEYVVYTTNTVGTNTISGITRGQAGTTAKAFFAGATIAVPVLAEDIIASAPWKYDEQSPTGASVAIPASGSIPASYLGINWRHIEIEWYGRTTSANSSDLLNLQFNGDTAAHYDWQSNTFTNALVAIQAVNNGNLRVGVLAGGSVGAGLFNSGWIKILNYAASTTRRSLTYACFRNDSSIQTDSGSGGWQNVANPITSITLTPAAGNWASGSLITTKLIP